MSSLIKTMRRDLTRQDVENAKRSLHDMFMTVMDEIIRNGDIDKLRPSEKVDFLMKLAGYIVPKPTDGLKVDDKDVRDINKLLSSQGVEETLKKQLPN